MESSTTGLARSLSLAHLDQVFAEFTTTITTETFRPTVRFELSAA